MQTHSIPNTTLAFALVPIIYLLHSHAVLSHGQDARREIVPEAQNRPTTTVLLVSQSSVSELLNGKFEYTVPFEYEVCETNAQGKAKCSGGIMVQLEESDKGVALRVRVEGTVHSNSVGRKGPASIVSKCVTEYVADKRMVFTSCGFEAEPATVESKTKLTISGIETELPGVRGVVVKRVAMQKALGTCEEAERVVREQTSRDICSQLDQKVDEQNQLIHLVLQNKSVFPYLNLISNLLSIRSTTGGIHISFGVTDCVNEKRGESSSGTLVSTEAMAK